MIFLLFHHFIEWGNFSFLEVCAIEFPLVIQWLMILYINSEKKSHSHQNWKDYQKCLCFWKSCVIPIQLVIPILDTIFTKNLLKRLAASTSFLIILLESSKKFFCGFILLDKRSFTVVQNFLLSLISYKFKSKFS